MSIFLKLTSIGVVLTSLIALDWRSQQSKESRDGWNHVVWSDDSTCWRILGLSNKRPSCTSARRPLRATTLSNKPTHFMRKGVKIISQKDSSRITNRTQHQSIQSAQHGQNTPPLLCLPSESLTNITSFLDPVSLCSLARTSRKLYEHVSDDNTWHRAFVCQFLGVSPEDALNETRPLTFRSTQKTWRHEFVRRHTIRR